MNIKKSYKLTFGLLSAMLLYTNNVTAQNGINSPYSRYGFGIQSDRSTSFNKSMSGVAQGYRDGQIINTQNPASYSAVDSMTALFDFGLTLQNGNYKMGKLQQNARNSSIDYAALHLELLKMSVLHSVSYLTLILDIHLPHHKKTSQETRIM